MFDNLTFYSIYLFLGVLVILLFGRVGIIRKNEFKIIILALHFRIVTTYGYYVYTLSNSADAHAYFAFAQTGSLYNVFEPGTAFIKNLSYVFYQLTKIFTNQYLMLYIPYSLCGFIGSIVFYSIIKKEYRKIGGKYSLEAGVLGLFLPNVIFWTSNIGKDSIVYMGLTLILYAMMTYSNMVKTGSIALIGSVITFMVRPHIVLLVFVSVPLGLFLEKKGFSLRNIFMSAIILVLFLVFYKTAFEYVGIDVSGKSENNAEIYESSMQNIEQRSNRLSSGGSAINRSYFSLALTPWYAIQFLFGPFLWQARKPIQMLAAIESIIYQIMFLFIIKNMKVYFNKTVIPFKYGIISFVILSSLIMGSTFTNIGLAVRQKTMVLPFFIAFYVFIRVKTRSHKKIQRGLLSNEW